MEIEVSGIHKFHISVTLRLLEKTLIEVERAANAPAPASPLFAYCDQVSRSIKEDALATVSEARSVVAAIADELGLPLGEESVTRALLGALHVGVVNVARLLPGNLSSGGPVPPALAEYIEPQAGRLETLLRRLIALLERQSQEERQ